MGFPSPKCRHCDVVMEEGRLLDRGHANQEEPPAFYQGTQPEEGAKVFGLPLFVVQWWDSRKKLGVATYRCPNCGYLESYAR
jgi:hypothetical protein